MMAFRRSIHGLQKKIFIEINKSIDAGYILGIQKIRSLWRIYIDNAELHLKLISSGIDIGEKHCDFHSTNPFIRQLAKDEVRVVVKDIPLSYSDLTICNTLKAQFSVQIIGKMTRTRLRVNGKLTLCETGDRSVIIKIPCKPLPRKVQFGAFTGRIYHDGQLKSTQTCGKRLQQGHFASVCKNEIVCIVCKKTGHKKNNCDEFDRHGNTILKVNQHDVVPISHPEDEHTSSEDEENDHGSKSTQQKITSFIKEHRHISKASSVDDRPKYNTKSRNQHNSSNDEQSDHRDKSTQKQITSFIKEHRDSANASSDYDGAKSRNERHRQKGSSESERDKDGQEAMPPRELLVGNKPPSGPCDHTRSKNNNKK